MDRRAVFLLSSLVFGSSVGACSRSAKTDRTETTSATLVHENAAASLADAVDFREYAVPTPDALPHDPAVAPDGALWVTEMKANKLGRLDPKSGVFREFALKTPDSGPHGLTVDEAGNVWFTASSKGYVGELFPTLGQVAEFPIADPRVKDPHTPLLGPNAILWFTAEQSNVVARLDRRTGRVEVAPLPRPHALPYGIALGIDGAPYVCEFGSNAIARIDPESLAVRELALPVGARPRRIALGIDGALYYTDYERGRLGKLDPRTGHVDEWLSPAGEGAKPYGMAITLDGMVWFSETGPDPNTLVRFDPRTRTFARMAIPSGGGVVRNMVATLDGRVFLAESGKDKVAIVTPHPPAPR